MLLNIKKTNLDFLKFKKKTVYLKKTFEIK